MGFESGWALAIFLAGSVAAGFTVGLAGFGAGPVALAFWLHVLPPAITAPVLALSVGIGQVQSFWVARHAFHWHRFWPMMAAGIVGIPFGIAILLRVPGETMSQAIGWVLVIYALVFIVTRARSRFTRGGRAADAAAGFGAGMLTGAAGLPGPPMSVWCSLRGWPKDEQRATMQPFNIVIVLIGAGFYAWHGLLNTRVGWLILMAVPAIAVGAWLGVAAYKRIDENQYRMVMLWALLVSGVGLAIGASR